MTLRFQQGEMAIYAIAGSPSMMRIVNEEVEVAAVGIKAGRYYFGLMASQDADYIVFCSGGGGLLCKDFQLRKINPPEEPASLKRTSDIEEEITA